MGTTVQKPALTESQRQLVDEYRWLVEMHVKTRVLNRPRSRSGPQKDDLIQEGCLGLIEAARRFKPERGIPFVAFALPRIQTAVNRIRLSHGLPMHVPHGVVRAVRRGECSLVIPGARTLVAEPTALPSGGHSVTSQPGRETVGDRLRAKYERAVWAAVEAEAQERGRRSDRRDVLERLAVHRLLVPAEEHRRSLRKIARETKSSGARIMQYEQRLRERIADVLGHDPQVQRLREVARGRDEGMDTPIDDALHLALAELAERRFVAVFDCGSPETRRQMVTRLLEASGRRASDLVRTLFAALPRDQQDLLWVESRAMAG